MMKSIRKLQRLSTATSNQKVYKAGTRRIQISAAASMLSMRQISEKAAFAIHFLQRAAHAETRKHVNKPRPIVVRPVSPDSPCKKVTHQPINRRQTLSHGKLSLHDAKTPNCPSARPQTRMFSTWWIFAAGLVPEAWKWLRRAGGRF